MLGNSLFGNLILGNIGSSGIDVYLVHNSIPVYLKVSNYNFVSKELLGLQRQNLVSPAVKLILYNTSIKSVDKI